MFTARLVLIGIIAALAMPAQTPPCGRTVVATGGSSLEDRFLPSPPDHARQSLLRALPIMGAVPSKVSDLHIEAKTDTTLRMALFRINKKAGAKGWSGAGMGAGGTFNIEIKPETQNGVAGSQVHIAFNKNKFKGRIGNPNQATPLLEEAACLARILSPLDPEKNPRGMVPESGIPTEPREVAVPKGTPMKLLLREFLYSKGIKAKAHEPIVFEVAEDVTLEGSTVIRRGALAIGKFTSAKAAGRASRGAKLVFELDHVVAADGQSIGVFGVTEKSVGNSNYNSFDPPIVNLLGKGDETIIRAGTGYDVETTQQYSVKVGTGR
jgi:hypothetical protein